MGLLERDAASAHPTILVLDDNRAIRLIVRTYLGGDVDYLEASSGEEALQVIEQKLPHLIVTDMNMPGMGGLEFLRRVRAHDRRAVSTIPVIVLTSENLESDCLRAGATAYVLKPVRPAEFQAVAKRCLAAGVHRPANPGTALPLHMAAAGH